MRWELRLYSLVNSDYESFENWVQCGPLKNERFGWDQKTVNDGIMQYTVYAVLGVDT